MLTLQIQCYDEDELTLVSQFVAQLAALRGRKIRAAEARRGPIVAHGNITGAAPAVSSPGGYGIVGSGYAPPDPEGSGIVGSGYAPPDPERPAQTVVAAQEPQTITEVEARNRIRVVIEGSEPKRLEANKILKERFGQKSINGMDPAALLQFVQTVEKEVK